MSSITTALAPRSRAMPPARSFTRQLLGDTMIRWGAGAGVAFIALMVLAAVFAPLIANSNPVFMEQAGHWSSPLIHNLEPGDVTLLVVFLAAVVLALVRGPSFASRAATLVWITAVTIPLTAWPAVADSWHGWQKSFGLTALYAVTGVLGPLDLAAIILLPVFTPATGRHRAVALASMAALGVLLIMLPVRPPAEVVYEQYRDDLKAGRIQQVIFAPLPFSPDDRLRDQPELRLTPPTLQHPMGTTTNGADLASNMIYASRIALSIGFISTGISVVIGVIVGGLMGYYSGWVDLLGMRVVEIFDAIPTLTLLLCFVAFFPPNLYIMMAIIGITGWVGDAVFVRAEFLRLREQDFVQAARACGLPLRSILFRHILPNGLTPVLINASFGIAGAILAESTLSFLGIGLTDEASWGRLLEQSSENGAFSWWIALYPGLAIFLTVFAYNLIGEALRDAIDPHLKKQA